MWKEVSGSGLRWTAARADSASAAGLTRFLQTVKEEVELPRDAESVKRGFLAQDILCGANIPVEAGAPLIIGTNPQICNVVIGGAQTAAKHLQVEFCEEGRIPNPVRFICSRDVWKKEGLPFCRPGRIFRSEPAEIFSLWSADKMKVPGEEGKRRTHDYDF